MSKRPADLVRPEVLAMKAYHVAPARGMVKLDAMENPHRLPPDLARAMGERLAGVAINRYPDPTAPELKRLLREAMGIPASLGVVLGNGSDELDRKSTRLNSSHSQISYAVFCLKKKK